MTDEQPTQPTAGQAPAAAQESTIEHKCRVALCSVSQPPLRVENFTPDEKAACALIHDKCLAAGSARIDDEMATFLAAHSQRLQLESQKAVDADAEPQPADGEV